MSSYNDKELYIYDKNDKFVTILSESTGLIDTLFKDYENHISDEAFVFNINNSAKYDQGYSTSDSGENNLTMVAGSYVGTLGEDDVDIVKNVSPIEFIKEESQVAFQDRDGELRLMRIKELYETTDSEGSIIKVICEPAYLELHDVFLEEYRPQEKTAQFVLDIALADSRYTGDVQIDLGTNSMSIYWINAIEVIWTILDKWGGSLKDTVSLDDNNNIVDRKINIVNRLGADRGLIIEPDYNAESIERNTLSYPATAMWGQGSSLEIQDEEGNLTDGHTRYITFENIEWKKSEGKPMDKPLGQKWIGDNDALAEFGYLYNGKRMHRFSHFSNQDYEDEEELLYATWQALQEQKLGEVTHEVSVFEADKHVSLGDTATIISREYNKPIEVQSQVSGLEYDILDDKEMLIVLGKYIDLSEDPLQKEIDDIKENVNRPTPPITDNSFPDIKPGTPVNVFASGAFQTINIWWEYESKVYIQHYEVYGSQNPDFIPDAQFLLYRGKVSAYNHQVKTDQKWYYYVRAINTHGTAGDYSARVQAETVRVINDDILFGEEIAQDLRDLDKISGIIGEGTIDIGNLHSSLPDHFKQQAKIYTDEEVEATRLTLVNSIADKANLSYVNGQLTSKADLADLNIVDGRVTNNESAIAVHDNEILARVTKEDYGIDMDGVISDIQLNGSNIIQNATKISSKVEQSQYNAFKGTTASKLSSIDQSFNEIRSTVREITIGEGNLFVGTSGEPSKVSISNGSSKQIASAGDPTKEIEATIAGTHTAHMVLQTIQTGVKIKLAFFTLTKAGDAIEEFESEVIILDSGVSQRGEFTFDIQEIPRYMGMSIENLSNKDIEISYSEVKLETGDVATNWMPKLDQFEGRMTQAESNITQNASNIELKVEVDEVLSSINLDSTGVRIRGDLIHLDGLTIIDKGIIKTAHIDNLAVTRGKLETAVIGTAQIENGVITNAKIANLNADKIDAGAIRGIDIYGAKFRSANGNNWMEIVGGDIHLHQSTGSYMDISPTGMYGREANGRIRFQADRSMVTSSVLGTSTANVYLGAEPGQEARVVSYTDLPGTGVPSDYEYLPVRALGFKGNYLDVNHQGTNALHLYLRTPSSGEIRLTSVETTDVWRPLRGSTIYANTFEDNRQMSSDYIYIRPHSAGDTQFRYANGNDAYSDTRMAYAYVNALTKNPAFTSNHLHIQAGVNGETRITTRGDADNYRAIRAGNFVNASSEKLKTNIQSVDDRALNIVNKLSVMEYDLIEDAGEGQQVGLIAENSPDVSTPDGKGINLYKLIAYNTKAIQELYTVIEKHLGVDINE